MTREHGTRNRYTIDGCRCDLCRKARADYQRKLHYRQVNGAVEADRVWDYGHVRLHLYQLREAGMGTRQIAALTGVARSELRRIADAERQWISQRTAAAILAAPLKPAPSTHVDGTLTARRIRSLAWLGWPVHWQATTSGVSLATASGLAAGARTQCRASTVEAIAALYREHSGTFGPSRSAAIRARGKGWESPMAWDDDDTQTDDDEPVCARCEDTEWLLGTGETLPQIAIRLGMTAGALERDLHRHGRHDLARRDTA